MGVGAAFLWSLCALFFGDAGMPGMTHAVRAAARRRATARAHIYLEVAAAVTVFILAGRYFEARAKRQSGAALRALLDLGAKDVAVLRDGVETRDPDRPSSRVGDLFVVRPGEKIATDGVVVDGHLRGRRLHAHRRVGARSRSARATPSPAPPSTPAAGCVVRATRVGADTQLAQMARLVEDAQTGKAPVQRLADRVSGGLRPRRHRARRWPPSACWLRHRARRRRPRSPPPSPC